MKKIPNEFNLGMDNRPAIYIPFAQAIPNVPTIDPTTCIKMQTGKCGICSKVCGVGAINYEQTDTFIEREYGAIVVATGFKPIDLDNFKPYNDKNVWGVNALKVQFYEEMPLYPHYVLRDLMLMAHPEMFLESDTTRYLKKLSDE